MSISAPPRRSEPEEATTQAASVHSNRNQMWYQKLCREEFQRALLEDPNESFPSPQRLQLQLHFQREYQQRQELQKNCRQEWWQRKSGLGPASPSPYNYRTPSPGRKFYAGAPVYYQDVPQNQPASTTLPRTLPPQPPPTRSYYQPAAADVESVSAECRRRIERDLIDRERDKMIKAAQVIKHDAEKRIRQAKRDLAVTPNDQGNIQRLLLQLLKEQDLAQKLKASSQVPPAPTPMSNLSVDLQYKLATLLQAYQPLQSQQVSANYQRKWQEQIGTYKDMLQEYRQGNFFQSHQKAKRLLQLLLQGEPPSAQVRLPPRFYPPDRQAVYQQYPNHDGSAPQPYFRAPLPPQANRPRRDPRLNRSSQQYYNRVNDITPRLNQSSYQYSEQDITPEIIYQADSSRKPGTVRRNSTPRKQCEEQAVQGVTVATSAEGDKKQQAEQHVTYADDLDRDFQKPMEAQTDSDTTLNRTSIASDEHDDSDNRSESREYLQDWEQLQQRSRCHRRGHRYRHSSEERMGSGQRKPVSVTGKVEKTNALISGSKEDRHLYANQMRQEGDIRIVVNGEYRKAYPVKDAPPEHLQSQQRARVCTGTRVKAPENFNQQTSDPHAEIIDKEEIHETNIQSNNYSSSNGDLVDKTGKVFRATEKTPEINAINGMSEIEENHWVPDGSGDSQTRGKFRVQFSSVHSGGGELETMTEEDDDGKSAEIPENNETARQGKDDNSVLKQNNKDTKETKGVTGQAPHSSQSSDRQQQRTKQQPPAQIRQNAQSRGQTSRHPQPQQNHRGSRQQPPPRSVRQSPAGSQQLSGNQHQMVNTRPQSQPSQKLSESRSVQTETRTSTKGIKSSVPVPPENTTEKPEGTKSPGSSVSKQGGKKSPGNTYVVRNSGQKLSSKAPPGAQREKAGSTKSQGSNTYSASISSPGSNDSKSPSDFPSKAQGSPPEKSRRRRYRRKPWEREETGPNKTSRSNSAPRSQNRFQEQGREVGQSGRWLSPSQRWMGRNANWESQPRRRRYQWEDPKTGPARKWKTYGQEGKALPSKMSSSEKDLRVSENDHPTTASSHQVKPVPETVDSSTSCDLENNSEDMDEYSFTTQHEMSSDKENTVFEENPSKEQQDEDGEKEKQPEEAGNEDTTEHHDEKKALKIVPDLSNSSETGISEETTMNTQNDSGEKKENGVDKKNKAEENQMFTNDPKVQTTVDAERWKTQQLEEASPDGLSDELETGVHASEYISETKTDLACGKGAPDSSTILASSEEETAYDSCIVAGEAEKSPSELQSLKVAQPETSLEHVLAVLGKKAAQNAEESEDENPERQQQVEPSEISDKGDEKRGASEHTGDTHQVPATTQDNETPEAVNDAVNKVATEPELSTSNAHGTAVENVTAPGFGEGTCVSTADGSSQTESVQHSPAKIIRLEEMEDWQSLDVPNQENCGNVESKDAVFNQHGNQDKIEQPETMPCAGDGSSAEKELGVTTENQAGTTQQLEGVGELSESRGKRDQKVTAVERSVRTDKLGDRHVSYNEVFESTSIENDAQNTSVQDSPRQSVVKEMQGPSAALEQETPVSLPENGEVLESSVLKAKEKQDELLPKDAPETDGPESGQVENAGERSKSTKDVPVVHSEPETASDESCLISKGESQDQETSDLKGSESATTNSEKESSQLLQPEKSDLQDHSSSVTAHAKDCEETTEDTKNHQHSATEELQKNGKHADSQTTDADRTAPHNKAVSDDCSDKESELQSQPDLPSAGESSQNTAIPSDVDLCTQEETVVISPLSALAQNAVFKFCDGQALPTAVSQTTCIQSDSIDRSKMTWSRNLAVSSAEDSSEFDSRHTKNGNTTDIPDGSSSDIPNGSSSDIPKGNTTDIPKGNTTDIPKGNTTDIPKGNTTDIPNGNTSDIPNCSTTDIPNGNQNTPNENTNDTPNENTDTLNENIDTPSDNAKDTPNDNANNTPNETANDTPNENANDTPNGKTTDTPNGNANDASNDETSNMNATNDCQMATNLDVQEHAEDRLKDGAVTESKSRNTDESIADLSESSTGDRKTEADGQDGSPTASDDVKKKSSPEKGNGFCCEDHNETDRTQTMVGLCSRCGRQRASENRKKSRLNFGEILHDKLTAFGYL